MRRSEIVLAILASAKGAALSPAQLQKAAFLVDRNAPDLFDRGHAFHFVPYDYGPFDKAVYDEAAALSRQDLAQINQASYGRWNLYSASQAGIEAGREVLNRMPENGRDYVERIVEWVRQQSFTSLVKSVYAAYPEMRANSIFQDLAMTILVGVKCSDGIVIGADSIATNVHGMQPLVRLQSNEKLQLVGPMGIIATTGSVGLSQRVKAIADEAWSPGKLFRGEPVKCFATLAGKVIEDFSKSGVPRTSHAGIGFGALLGMVVEDQAYLVEFGTVDFQPEIKQGNLFAVSIGSGQIQADPFLAFVSRVLWQGVEPDVNLGKIGVYWALSHTIRYAPGGVGPPIKLGVIKLENGKWAASVTDETQEQEQYIDALEAGICPKEAVEAEAVVDIPEMNKDAND